MSPITVYSNWCYNDQLDGVQLKDGERLRIEWPNGDRTEEYVHVEDQGHDSHEGHIPAMRSYVATFMRGVPVKLFLRDDKGRSLVMAERAPSTPIREVGDG